MKYVILVTIFSTLLICNEEKELNACDDPTYKELKTKGINEMSDREYDYFKIKDKECQNYNNSWQFKNKGKKQSSAQFNYKDNEIFLTLSENKQKEFMRNKITIKKINNHRYSYRGGYTRTGFNPWNAYIGFDEPLSELDFFELLGYDNEVKEVKKHKFKGAMYMLGSIPLWVGGVYFIATGENTQKCDEYGCQNENSNTLPALLSWGVAGGMSGYGWVKFNGKWAEFATVEKISDDYNIKLLEDLNSN